MSTTTERRLSAIMLADVAGFSSLMEKDESGTFERVRELREQLVTPRIAEHGGRIIKTTGDGFLAEFPSATSALRCGVEIQRANQAREQSRPEGERIHLRIGLNVGDIITDGDDIAGDGVNIAARLEALAPLDGICVSGTVREHIRQDLGIEYRDLGDQHVKNISRPIRAFQIDLAGNTGITVKPVQHKLRKTRKSLAIASVVAAAVLIVGALAWVSGAISLRTPMAPYSSEDRRMTFAVLPFTAPEDDKAVAAFANAVTESLTTLFSQSAWSRVVSRGSVEDALKKNTSAKDLGRVLDVHFLVRGNVARVGDRFAISATVTDTRADRVLGGYDFKWPEGPSPNPQSGKLDELRGRLTYFGYKVELERAKQKKQEDLDVRDLSYLVKDVWKNDKETYEKAMLLVRRALAQAPNDRLALSQMAELNLCECRRHWSTAPEEQEKIGEDAVQKLLRIEPSHRRALMWQAGLHELHGRFEDSLVIVEGLLAKDPADERALATKAYDLLKIGKAADALPLTEHLLRLEEGSSYRDLGAAVYYALGEYRKAADLARMAAAKMDKADLSDPISGSVRLTQVAAEGRLGNKQQANAALADFHAVVPDAKSIAAIRKWQDPRAYLATFEPLYEGLREAGVPE